MPKSITGGLVGGAVIAIIFALLELWFVDAVVSGLVCVVLLELAFPSRSREQPEDNEPDQ